MATTIQISKNLQEKLNARKFSDNESYEEVIWDLIEDSLELSEETKKSIRQAEREIKEGKVHTLEEAKKELGP
ncbi:hypothetical protein JXB11_00450 [Candidatus Woesearchaeota archaeon]|nr:hypothetical protein [Candidatus Woesearchaeota archaeon]